LGAVFAIFAGFYHWSKLFFGLKLYSSYELKNSLLTPEQAIDVDKLMIATYFYNDLFYNDTFKFNSFLEGLLWFRSTGYLSDYLGVISFYINFYWS
jgi:hypothetical protein